MENYFIEETEDTPRIEFSAESHVFTISGRSLPENAIDFYAPVLEWVDKTLDENERESFTFEIKIEYFNTSSSKQLAKLFLTIEKYFEKHDILIKWFYEKEDLDMLMSGNQYSKFLKLNFKFIEN
ncbi:MAG: DUF1987 domain-containing protein [Bacteroidales bacterium]|nr:DUF1987 domain-containing protein [Bacteroidales bacterium]